MEKDRLREKAEKLLSSRGVIDASIYANNLEGLVEELSIFQFELEHQNLELQNSRKEVEQAKDKYKDLFNNAPVGYLIMRKNADILEVNQTACDLLNLEKSEFLKYPFSKNIHPEYQDTFYFHLKQVLKNNSTSSCDLKIKRSEGKYFFARLITSIQKSQNGDDALLRLTILDINTQKELELRLIQERSRAQESDRLKSAFLANMSHEIRTPMNSILGFSSLIVDRDLTDEQRKRFLKTINESGNYLLKLINDILDISKMDANQIKINKTACNMIEVCSYCYNVIINDPKTRRKQNVVINLRITEQNRGIVTLTDSERLKQVILNLLSNAVKFTETGSVEFGFNIKHYSNKPVVEFFVKDTGKGIPQDKLGFIFERFSQVKDDDSHHGTGLGLSICKGVVELLGGEIHVSSRVNEGSLFTFTIPYEKLVDGKAEEVELTTKKMDLNGQLIVIAEDDEPSYLYLRELLSELNAPVERVKNGQELIELVEKQEPLLILLDINMPVKSGYDALIELKRKRIGSKIIVQTAYAMSDERSRFLNAGADGYISKPIHRENLLDLIAKTLKI